MTRSSVSHGQSSQADFKASKPTRTQRRAAETRKSIIAAAREIIVANGAEALTLDEVAEDADVAVQTIYNRIGGRPALMVAVAEEAMRECRAYMDAAYEGEGTAEERLFAAIDAYARFAKERPHEFQILVEPPDVPEAVDQIVALTERHNGQLADTLRAAILDGSARDDLDPVELSTVFWATVNGLLALTWRPGKLKVTQDQLDSLIATYAATIADGLRAK